MTGQGVTVFVFRLMIYEVDVNVEDNNQLVLLQTASIFQAT